MDALPAGRGPARAARRTSAACIVEARWWYGAAADAVLDAWLDPAVASRWLFATASRPLRAASIDARPGGALRLVTREGEVIAGRLDAAVPPTIVRFTLDVGVRQTMVDVDARPLAAGTAVHVRHAGVPARCADWLETRWIGMLYGLGEALDCDSHELSSTREPR